MKVLLLLILVSFSSTSLAYDNLEFELDSGSALNITHYEGSGKTLMIWLPSERGFGPGHVPVALDLAALELDVWAAHLHESYIIPTGRYSLNEVDVDDLVELIDIAQGQGYEEIFIISSSRGAQLALKMALQWQQRTALSKYIKGLMLFSAHFIEGKTAIGQQAKYVDIVSFSNLPVYMLQAQYSTKFARSHEIARQLQRGGSPTYIHSFRGVQGGFHVRPAEDLTQTDLQARAQLAQVLENATNLLRSSTPAPLDHRFKLSISDGESEPTAMQEPRLHEYRGNAETPELKLLDLQGRPFELSESRGEVVLVNFWASWCGPCVREIPSLARLVETMKARPFRVIAVNVGESTDTINQFLKSVPVNFDILLDENALAVRDWNVYAYPSNFVIDKAGEIRFGYRGALEWDSTEVVRTIEKLF